MLHRRAFLAIGAAACIAKPTDGAMAEESAAFETVTKDRFRAALEGTKTSAAFKRLYPRYQRSIFQDFGAPVDYKIHVGDLTHRGSFQIPAYKALVLGNVTIEWMCDLTNPPDRDEAGAFIVVGNVTCRSLTNLSGGRIAMIDGNLTATDAILNDAEGSSLLVTGDLKTKWYQGIDIWVEVGGTAKMNYGDGYALPLGGSDAGAQTDPAHDAETSIKALDPAIDRNRDAFSVKLLDRLRKRRRPSQAGPLDERK